MFAPPFDYSVVDGLGRARQRGIAPKLDGKVFRARAAGPAVELAHLEAGIDLPSLASQSWFDDGSLGELLTALVAKPSQWLAQDGRLGFVSASGLEQETILTSFKIDAHKAARAAGFGSAAALLVAALGELTGNVIDHSDAPESGIAPALAEDKKDKEKDAKVASIETIMKEAHGEDGLRAKIKTAVKEKKWDDAKKEAEAWTKLAADLGKNKQPKGEDASWKKMTEAYEKSIKTLATAIKDEKASDVKTAEAAIGKSCGSCHKAHKP